MARLAGKAAIIAGAAFGIGRATATIMAREGARVIVGDYDADAAGVAAEAIRKGGGEAHSLFFDATNEESVRELVAKTKERYGRVDIMHNNVGGTEPGKDADVVALDVAAWDRILKLTLHSAMYGCRHVIPVMLQTGGGAIVNTASMAALFPLTPDPIYSATKAAVAMYTRACAPLAEEGIRVNAVLPGLVDTPLLGKSGDGARWADWAYAAEQLMGLLPPEEVAAAVLDLVRDDTAVAQERVVGALPLAPETER
jgi:NAD(P)-dependent dehydrogenase (short-subunit alcohol dehydrogenase family)